MLQYIAKQKGPQPSKLGLTEQWLLVYVQRPFSHLILPLERELEVAYTMLKLYTCIEDYLSASRTEILFG